MTKDELAASLKAGAEAAQTLAVTGPLLRRAAERFAGPAPRLWKALEPAWAQRRFAQPDDAWLLMLNALHYEALRRPGDPLAPLFPTCRGAAGEITAAVDHHLDEPSESLARQLLERSRSGYADCWATLWTSPAGRFFQPRQLPYIVAEIGTIGGLYAAGDLLLPVEGFRSDLIMGRVGIDARPLRLDVGEDRDWLLASTFPENVEQFHALESVIARYAKLAQGSGARPVTLAACEPALAPVAVAKNVRPEPDLGLLVLTTWETQRLESSELARFRANMLPLLRQWDDRALWLELATPAGGRRGQDVELTAHRAAPSGLASRALYEIELGARTSLDADDDANDAFLS